MASQPQDREFVIKRIKEILNTYGDELRKRHGTDQIAIGLKIKDDKVTDQVALIFFVKKKKDEKELLKEGIESVPEFIDGIPTDVVEIEGFRFH